MKKVLGICGSPREGNTELLLEAVLNGARELGAETELINLREKNIKLCDGCLACEEIGECHLKDDMQEIFPKMLDADVFVLGTPTYFDTVSGNMKIFMDRTNPLCGKLAGKAVGIVAVGQAGLESIRGAVETLKKFSEIHEMKVVGTVCGVARAPKEIANEEKILKECKALAEKISRDT